MENWDYIVDLIVADGKKYTPDKLPPDGLLKTMNWIHVLPQQFKRNDHIPATIGPGEIHCFTDEEDMIKWAEREYKHFFEAHKLAKEISSSMIHLFKERENLEKWYGHLINRLSECATENAIKNNASQPSCSWIFENNILPPSQRTGTNFREVPTQTFAPDLHIWGRPQLPAANWWKVISAVIVGQITPPAQAGGLRLFINTPQPKQLSLWGNPYGPTEYPTLNFGPDLMFDNKAEALQDFQNVV